MKCQYCTSTCNVIYTNENIHHIYQCVKCNVNFFMFVTTENKVTSEVVKGVELFAQKREQDMYSILLVLERKKSRVYVRSKILNEDGTHFKNKYSKKLIHTFDRIVDVTPSNVDKKLETILTFL